VHFGGHCITQSAGRAERASSPVMRRLSCIRQRRIDLELRRRDSAMSRRRRAPRLMPQASGRFPQHLGNRLQLQNSVPACRPRFASPFSMAAPHFGQPLGIMDSAGRGGSSRWMSIRAPSSSASACAPRSESAIRAAHHR
jgi:hypothetical protein